MTKDDHKLWEAVAATVTPLGEPRKEVVVSIGAVQRAAPLPLPVSRSTLDLHGLTVNDAYRATLDFIANSGRRSTLTIITGKSGQIRREFERWVGGLPKVHSVTPKCGGGAFTVRILKNYRSS